jgi:elongation of very long chain fatty acids protein 6
MYRYAVPRYVAMVITSLQLIQMVIGCSVNYLAYQYKQNGRYHALQ